MLLLDEIQPTVLNSGFLSRMKTSANFAFLRRSTKVLFAKINLELVLDTTTSVDIPCNLCQLLPHVKVVSTANNGLFAYFQHVDSVLPNPDGPLSMAVPVLTIRAANREVILVLNLSSMAEKNPTLTSKQ